MDESRRKKGRYTDMQRIITQVISNCVMNNDAIWMAGWVPYQFKIVFKDSNNKCYSHFLHPSDL